MAAVHLISGGGVAGSEGNREQSTFSQASNALLVRDMRTGAGSKTILVQHVLEKRGTPLISPSLWRARELEPGALPVSAEERGRAASVTRARARVLLIT
eukprot:3937563-Rhodomonas_salina.3